MRLNKLHVRSFKSINNLESFDINDTKITSIIGKNGSGKSNILHAINALKDTSQLVDSNRYEKIDKDQEIFIQAHFALNEADTNLFEDTPIDPKDIDGFIVTVKKELDKEDISTTVTPINFTRKVSGEVVKQIKPIVKRVMENADIGDDKKEQAKKCLDLIQKKAEEKQIVGPIPELITEIDTIEKIIELIDDDSLPKVLEEAKVMASFDIVSFVKDVLWAQLNINLLSFNDYPIKTEAPLEEITNGDHPFIKDLLDLTNLKVEDFKTTGEDLNNHKNDASGILNQQLKNVWEDQKLEFVIDVQEGSLMVFFITPQTRRRKLDDLSDGQKWFLGFYTKLAVARKRKKQILWLFDEPGQNLHASSQHALQHYFEDVSVVSQIFYASHQPMMIPWHRLERILVAENNEKLGTILSEKIWKDGEAISPLREALGLFVGESLLTGNEHIIVEGPSDYIYLTGWWIFFQKTLGKTAKYWNEDFSFMNRTIVPAGGGNNIPLYLLFLTGKTKGSISTVAVPDTKDLSIDIVKKLKEMGLDPLTKKVFSFEEIVGKTGRPVKDVEDLFGPTEWLTFVKEYYEANKKEVSIPKKFATPTKSKLKDGIISYTKKMLNVDDVDKTGVAFDIYRKLVNTKRNIFDDETRKRFLNVFKEINKKFD